MNQNTHNIPTLRFPEFEGEWGKIKLKNVSRYFNGGSFENYVQEKGKYELVTLKSIDVNGNLVHSKRFIDIEVPTLSRNTLVMILSEQAPGLLGMTALIPTDNKYVLNQRVAEIRPNDKVATYFLSMAINRNQSYFSKHGAGTKVQNISKPNVENYKFLCPSLPEQQKIASFLTAVDDKISQLTKKKELLEDYKKGVMQRIFSLNHDSCDLHDDHDGVKDEKKSGQSQQSKKSTFRLRFRDENGNDFPEWEEKKLGEVCNVKRGAGSQYLKYSQENLKNSIRLIRIGDFLGSEPVFVDNTKELKRFLLHKDDILIAGTGATAGITFKIPDQFVGLAYSYNAPRIKVIHHSAQFFIHLLKSDIILKQQKRLFVGNAQPFLDTNAIKNFKFHLPSLLEQQKIASFLTSIDQKIEQVNTQLEKAKTWKKGLLQKMFV